MGTRSSQLLMAAVAIGLGVFWIVVAPHVAVRHWDSDVNAAVHCRQMLTGTSQWSDPLARLGWTRDAGPTHYC